MRPNTSESGIFSTKRNSPVSTSMLTRMLVPKPNSAFQSPGVHNAGLKVDVPAVPVVLVLIIIPLLLPFLESPVKAPCSTAAEFGDPAENAALGLDHLQAHLVEFGKVGCAAVRQHHAAIAAVVGFAHGGVDADLGGDAADQQILDAVALQHVAEFGGVERALARLVDHDLAVERIQLGNDVVAGLAANENAPHRPGIADAQRRRAALDLGRRRIRQIGQMALAGVHDQHAGARAASSTAAIGFTARASWPTSLPSVSPKPPGSMKSRCMSMMRSAVAAQSSAIGSGSAASFGPEFAMTYAPRTRTLQGQVKQSPCHCVQ